MLLSVTNSCYDVYGSLAPITVKLKIALRRINGYEWDDDLPIEVKRKLWEGGDTMSIFTYDLTAILVDT